MAAAGAGKQARVATGPQAGGVELWEGWMVCQPVRARSRQRYRLGAGTRIICQDLTLRLSLDVV